MKTLELTDFLPDITQYSTEGESLILDGQKQARQAYSELITQQYTTYILTRARELSLDPEIELLVHPETGLIQNLTLRCQATPAEKSLLTDLLCRDLGIERSALHWKS